MNPKASHFGALNPGARTQSVMAANAEPELKKI
jgi:hypothetical protein